MYYFCNEIKGNLFKRIKVIRENYKINRKENHLTKRAAFKMSGINYFFKKKAK